MPFLARVGGVAADWDDPRGAGSLRPPRRHACLHARRLAGAPGALAAPEAWPEFLPRHSGVGAEPGPPVLDPGDLHRQHRPGRLRRGALHPESRNGSRMPNGPLRCRAASNDRPGRDDRSARWWLKARVGSLRKSGLTEGSSHMAPRPDAATPAAQLWPPARVPPPMPASKACRLSASAANRSQPCKTSAFRSPAIRSRTAPVTSRWRH